jgi:hypothetical protein
VYVEGNPINYSDPSGMCGIPGEPPCPVQTTPPPPVPITTVPTSTPSPEDIRRPQELARIRDIIGDIICTPVITPITQYLPDDGFWMVIKYSTYSKWKWYTTNNIVVDAKVVLGIGGGVGYACDTASSECSITGSAEIGHAGKFMGIELGFKIGIGGTYSLTDRSFTGGLVAGLGGPCSLFINYAYINFTCSTDGLMQQAEFGWKRNPYEAYWVLVHTSQTGAAGGIEVFGKRVLVDRRYPDLDLQYKIMDTDRARLSIRYLNRGIPLIRY